MLIAIVLIVCHNNNKLRFHKPKHAVKFTIDHEFIALIALDINTKINCNLHHTVNTDANKVYI